MEDQSYRGEWAVKNCRYCGHELSTKYIENKAKQKSERIKAARRLARINGEQIGPKRKYDRDKIIELRKIGMSIREIAREVGCTTWPVQCAINSMDQNESGK